MEAGLEARSKSWNETPAPRLRFHAVAVSGRGFSVRREARQTIVSGERRATWQVGEKIEMQVLASRREGRTRDSRPVSGPFLPK